MSASEMRAVVEIRAAARAKFTITSAQPNALDTAPSAPQMKPAIKMSVNNKI